MLVLDATVLINFGGIGAFEILKQLVTSQLIAVEEVVDEVRRPPASTRLRQALDNGWIRRHRLATDEELAWVVNLNSRSPRLDNGELASLAACFANGWDFASDDRDARRMVSVVGIDPPITVTGTIGLLLSAIRHDVIDVANAESKCEQMVAGGFRSPVGRLADFLEPR